MWHVVSIERRQLEHDRPEYDHGSHSRRRHRGPHVPGRAARTPVPTTSGVRARRSTRRERARSRDDDSGARWSVRAPRRARRLRRHSKDARVPALPNDPDPRTVTGCRSAPDRLRYRHPMISDMSSQAHASSPSVPLGDGRRSRHETAL
jgi:hypothetical protein